MSVDFDTYHIQKIIDYSRFKTAIDFSVFTTYYICSSLYAVQLKE